MSKPNHQNSNIQRIEITIRIDEPLYVKELLIVYFHFKNSPTYPLCVRFDGILNRSTGEANTRNFRIVEYDEEKDYSSELAEIRINPFPSHIVVFIEMVSEDDISWEKVKEITTEIIDKMRELDFEIESVKPDELIPKSLLPLWKQIPNHGAEREILKFWHKGYTNSEIGDKVGKDKLTVTNIISKLRVQYGEEIVPKKKAIQRSLRDNKL